jgi:hypothetical protein
VTIKGCDVFSYISNANVGYSDSMFDNRHRHASLVGGPEKREFADLIERRKNCIF